MDESTLIHSVRRKVIIDRHRDVLLETESSISDSFIDGTIDHPRLQAMLRELDEDSERQRIRRSLKRILGGRESAGQTLRHALVELLCLQRDRHQTEIATLQMHAVGLYRTLARLFDKHLGWRPDLEQMRRLDVATCAALLSNKRHTFGSIDFVQPYPPALRDATAAVITAIRREPGQDQDWHDDSAGEAVPRDVADKVEQLPEQDRRDAIRDLLADQVRSRFYHEVFCRYFARDEFDPDSVEDCRCILDWLQAIRDTPHLFLFMQGQSQTQKNFRLAQLTTKLVQIAEMYQRVERARQDSALSQELGAGDTRTCLGILARKRFPPGRVDADFTTSVYRYPLLDFACWVQERFAANDFVLPPEGRRRGMQSSTHLEQVQFSEDTGV